MEIPTRTFVRDGITLEYVDVGPRDADTVLFLHGNGPNWRQYRPQLETLSPRWRLLALSLRGHGGSGLPPTPTVEDLSLPVLAGDATGLLDHLGVERCHLVGNSVGGLIGFELALGSPGRIASLVTFGTTAELRSSRTLLWSLTATIRLLGPGGVGRIAARTAATPEAGRALRDLIASADGRALRLISHNVATYDYTAALRTSRVPWLLLRGELDRDINRNLTSTLDVLRERVDASVQDVPGAGHFANLERPALFDAALETFLGAQAMHPRGDARQGVR